MFSENVNMCVTVRFSLRYLSQTSVKAICCCTILFNIMSPMHSVFSMEPAMEQASGQAAPKPFLLPDQAKHGDITASDSVPSVTLHKASCTDRNQQSESIRIGLVSY